jgi:hypothetical protein
MNYKDLGGVIDRIAGETGAELLFFRHPGSGQEARRQRAALSAAGLALPWMQPAGDRPRASRTARPYRARARAGVCPAGR